MSVKKRPNGKWRARYRDEAGREYARHFDTQREAKAWESLKRSEVARGEHLAPAGGRQTLAEFYDDVYVPRKDWVTKTRVVNARTMAACTFRDMPLARIRRAHVQDWVRHMRTEEGLAVRTLRTRFYFVVSVLNAAVTDHLIRDNPADGVELPRLTARDQTVLVPQPAQVAALLDESPTPAYRRLYSTAAFAGLRLGEIRGLQAYDLDGQTLHVRRQVQAVKGGREIREPKYGSVRDVHLAPVLAGLLAEQVAEVGAVGDAWVFPSVQRSSAPVSESTVHATIKLMGARAGLPEELAHVHVLRHFYASGLIAAGCDVVTVQRALGHKRPSMTLDVYSHLWHTAEDRTRAAAADLMRSAAGADSSGASGV